MPIPQQPTLIVFGATGGCVANALLAALRDGITSVAMVRSTEKLRRMLLDQYHMPSEVLDKHLKITQGNIRSIDDVERALTINGHLPDKIVFGVGGSPRFNFSLLAPLTLDDPHICEEGMKTLISALRSCQSRGVPDGPLGMRPHLVTISTISMSNHRDLPYLYYPMEYWLLSIPRADKLAMEKVIFAAASEVESPLGDFAMVRPPILLDSPVLGFDKIRAGWVWPDAHREEKLARGQKEAGPQIGYTVSKPDVGEWIFANMIKNGMDLHGKCWNLAV